MALCNLMTIEPLTLYVKSRACVRGFNGLLSILSESEVNEDYVIMVQLFLAHHAVFSVHVWFLFCCLFFLL